MVVSHASPTIVNTIIVGGGHAGVNLACMMELRKKQQQHEDFSYLILEKSDSLLSKWRDKRWDHFQLNTPVKFSRLHGQSDNDPRDDWLLDRPLQQDLDGWDAHIRDLKILDNTKLKANVVSVNPKDDGIFETIVDEADNTTMYRSKNVVACNGVYDHNIVPSSLAKALPASIKQHTSGGFRIDDLAPGNILVVGSSQSGIQLANILLDQLDGKERTIYLSCSAAGGCPRSFREHDLFYWLHRMKFLYIPKEALAGMPPEKAEGMRYAGAPVTGPNKAISPFSLERRGVILTGRLKEVVTDSSNGAVELQFQNDRCTSLRAAKDGHSKIVGAIRDFASKLEAETDETFPPDVPEAEWEITNDSLLNDPGILSLDVEKAGIKNVLWACGWCSNLGWLKVDQNPQTNDDFNERTNLPDRIISKKYPGLFFAGYPWVGTIQSMNILNMDKDAEVILANMNN